MPSLPPPVIPEGRPQCVRQPSRAVRELLTGAAVPSARVSDPVIPRGVQLPTEQFEGERSSSVDERDEVERGLVLDGQGEDELTEHNLATAVSEAEVLEPRTLNEAKQRPDWPLWEKAINEELATLHTAGTWVLKEAPPGVNIVGSKWVFKAKKDASGNVVRYKAQLVAQGFSQVPGVDYFDTYAPVAKLPSIRTILSIATRLDMEMHQVDIKGAYLNGDLTSAEVIYMKPPPGYAPDDLGKRVLRLKRTLYGLKQSGRRWYQKLTAIFVDGLGFRRCEVDQAVFYKRKGKSLIVIAVHVDDCTIAASTLALIDEFKARLKDHVEITDLGELHWLLGIEILRDRQARLVHLSQ